MDRVEQLTAELKRRSRWALAVCVLLAVGLGGWSATAQISGAVIAAGRMVVDGNLKKVQHPTGGIVNQLKVKVGDRVQANDLLIRLDETQARSSLGVIQTQLAQNKGRKARLEAERDQAAAILFPGGFDAIPGADQIMSGETKLFQSRRDSINSQKSQHSERIRQLKEEISGLAAQLVSKDRELVLQNAEIERVQGLHSSRLIPETRMASLQRDVARLDGERGGLVAQIARSKAQISQIEIQILQVDGDARSEAQKELREVEAKIAELDERRVAAEDQLSRVEIRAPIGGVVHELNVFTVGGVIQPGETTMQIVPAGDKLIIEARILPHERSQVAVGMRSVLRYTAFNQRTTPEFVGTVTDVSAEVSRDQATGGSYYVVRISLDEAESAKAAGLNIVAGMPVECFIETGQRTALSYFVKPFVDSFHHLFRQQ